MFHNVGFRKLELFIKYFYRIPGGTRFIYPTERQKMYLIITGMYARADIPETIRWAFYRICQNVSIIGYLGLLAGVPVISTVVRETSGSSVLAAVLHIP